MNSLSFFERYTKEIVPAMKEKFHYRNIYVIPCLDKIVLNIGTSLASKDSKFLETMENTLIRISGQKPISCLAKKSIAAFKTRKGQVVGKKVTLRGKRMYDFVEKLIKVALPRLRDFRGLKKESVDPNGNLTIGFQEYIVFPEIRADEIERLHGLEVTIVTTAKTKEEALELFKLLGFPFRA